MGNTVSAAFDIKDQIASGGPGHLWRVYAGTRKSTGQNCAIFLFDKNYLESINPLAKPSLQSRRDQDRAIELLKKEASNLARLRHPSILEVTEAPDDSKLALAFASEPVLFCLSNVLGTFENFTTAGKADLRKKNELDELEIQKGIMQIVKGLEFLHANKWTHTCLSPESIYVNAKSDWKISGFNFSVCTTATPSVTTSSFFAGDFPPFCGPNLDYLAPEIVLDNKAHLPESDLWSLGCLIYSVFNNGASPIACNDNTHSYQNQLQKIHTLDMSMVPETLRGPLKGLLVRDPSQRLSLEEFEKCPYFDSVLVATISFLESFLEKTQLQRAQFLKGLVQMLPLFSIKLINRKILPSLLNEMKDPLMAPFILPNIFWICDHISDEEFSQKILPALKPLFKMTDPPQAILLLLSRMDVLQKKCSSPESFRQDIFPLLFSALDVPVIQVQEQALKMLPPTLSKLDFTTIKSQLFPKIQALFLQSASMSVRINSLIAIHAMVKSLDKFTLLEKVIPALKQNKVREPGIMLAALAVYDELGRHVDKEIIATEVLPELWRMSIDRVLNADQFKKFMKIIRELSTKVEEQHLKMLQELKSVEVGSLSSGDKGSSGNDQAVDFKMLLKGSLKSGNGVSSPTASPKLSKVELSSASSTNPPSIGQDSGFSRNSISSPSKSHAPMVLSIPLSSAKKATSSISFPPAAGSSSFGSQSAASGSSTITSLPPASGFSSFPSPSGILQPKLIAPESKPSPSSELWKAQPSLASMSSSTSSFTSPLSTGLSSDLSTKPSITSAASSGFNFSQPVFQSPAGGWASMAPTTSSASTATGTSSLHFSTQQQQPFGAQATQLSSGLGLPPNFGMSTFQATNAMAGFDHKKLGSSSTQPSKKNNDLNDFDPF
ncbi:kinase-like domain-containing protein [Zopfochytrium polystomum]|nr:kinase-like domain-containing protein [Zopfochytrium polystomum]